MLCTLPSGKCGWVPDSGPQVGCSEGYTSVQETVKHGPDTMRGELDGLGVFGVTSCLLTE